MEPGQRRLLASMISGRRREEKESRKRAFEKAFQIEMRQERHKKDKRSKKERHRRDDSEDRRTRDRKEDKGKKEKSSKKSKNKNKKEEDNYQEIDYAKERELNRIKKFESQIRKSEDPLDKMNIMFAPTTSKNNDSDTISDKSNEESKNQSDDEFIGPKPFP